MNQSIIQEKVMRRVYSIWLYRRISSSRVIRLVGLAALMGMASARVSFFDVARNLKHINWQFQSLFHYFSEAIIKTESSVKVITLLSVALVALFAWDASRAAGKLLFGAKMKKSDIL
jgi:hypothetical protein